VDEILRHVVGAFETTFEGRVRSYYLTGSFADGTAQPFSDIDLSLLFRGGLAAAEEEAAFKLTRECAEASTSELDVATLGDPIVYPLRVTGIKLGSHLLYGEDVREAMPLPPLEEYVRHAMDLTFRLISGFRGPDATLSVRAAVPDPGAEFLGYITGGATTGRGTTAPSTKNLVVTTGLMATSLLAAGAGCYVGGKRDAIRMYRALIGGPWAEFLEEIHTSCRDRWEYRLPGAPEERRHLSGLCRRMPVFESYFLTAYREHLLAEMDRGEENRTRARRRLARLVLE
jgi:predicted nucleotidyltransferase